MGPHEDKRRSLIKEGIKTILGLDDRFLCRLSYTAKRERTNDHEMMKRYKVGHLALNKMKWKMGPHKDRERSLTEA